MALINCPECNKQISDKATACPNCGYPINEKQLSELKYNVILTELLNDCDKIKLIGSIRGIKGWGLAETKNIIENPPQVIFNNMDYDSAISAQEALKGFGALTKLEETTSNNFETKENKVFKSYSDATIICPHCGSTAVTTGQKGFSLFTGFWGSNKTVNRCGKCGWTWQPK